MFLFLLPFLLLAALVDSAPPKEVGKHFLKMGKQGDYQYGYNDGHAVKEESRYADGTVRGSYHYVDANRVTQNVVYRADKNGFVATSTSELLGVGQEPHLKVSVPVTAEDVRPPPVVPTPPSNQELPAVSDFDIRFAPDQLNVQPNPSAPLCSALPLGYPVVPAPPKDNHLQFRVGEQPQVMYVSFMIPYVLHPQHENATKT
ncbi:hypothetical protein RP20_CCG023917 [Aedes albopictus]|nr:hypothetical protein RP20_CCG023917 [Aedes albopictus]